MAENQQLGPLDLFFQEVMSSTIIGIFVTAMVVLAIIDFLTFFFRKSGQHRDFKTPIVSLGILGTFVGVTIGLLEFNSIRIDEEDIQGLLEGLRVAFVTSVVGMAISILLGVFQRTIDASSGKENTEQFDKIVQLIEMQTVSIDRGNEIQYEGLYRVEENTANTHKEVAKGFKLVAETHERFERDLQLKLDKINTTLEQSMEKLAQAASQEIIDGLRQVVQDFNNTIQEQFGESMRQLSKACENLLVWQQQHKEEVDQAHQQLQLTLDVLDQTSHTLTTIADRNKSILDLYDHLGRIIKTADNQAQTLMHHIERFAAIAESVDQMLSKVETGFVDAQETIRGMSAEAKTSLREQTEEFTKATEKMRETLAFEMSTLADSVRSSCEKTFGVLATQVQDFVSESGKSITDTLDSAHKSLNEISVRIEEINSKVASGVEKTDRKIDQQTDAIGKFTQDLEKALNEMETIFVRVTQHLAKTYETLPEQLKPLLETLQRELRQAVKEARDE